jgi:hypothetical protein
MNRLIIRISLHEDTPVASIMIPSGMMGLNTGNQPFSLLSLKIGINWKFPGKLIHKRRENSVITLTFAVLNLGMLC